MVQPILSSPMFPFISSHLSLSLFLCLCVICYYRYRVEIKFKYTDYEISTKSGIFIYIERTSFLRPLPFPLPSGFGLLNRFFSFVRQREKKCEFELFLSRCAGRFNFLCAPRRIDGFYYNLAVSPLSPTISTNTAPDSLTYMYLCLEFSNTPASATPLL